MITYQTEAFSNFRKEAEDRGIFTRHYEEVAQFKNIQKLDLDWATYEFYEKFGKLWAMTVRDAGILVGYIVFIKSNHMHYKMLPSANEDMHFIEKSHRKGLIGYKLIKLAIADLKRQGVQFCMLRTKAGHDHGKLFQRLRGVKHDIVYAWDLTEG